MTEVQYIDYRDVAAYFEQYGPVPPEWLAATETEQLQAVNFASRWIDLTFGARWKGRRVRSDQARDWPRLGVVDDDGVEVPADSTPTAVRYAAAEAAVLRRKGQLTSLPDRTANTRIRRVMKKAGDDVKDIEYAGSGLAEGAAAHAFPLIESILAKLLEDQGGAVPVTLLPW